MNTPNVRTDLSRRAAIIETAAALFARDGLGKASLGDIAKLVGIKKPSLYYFFDSREALLLEVLEPVVEQPYRELRRIVDSDADVPDKIIRAMASLGRVYSESPERMQILTRERLERHLSPDAFDTIQQAKIAYTRAWQELLREGIRTGIFDRLDVKVTSFGLIGTMNWMYAWFDPDGELSGEEVGEILARQWLGGLLSSRHTTVRRKVRAPIINPKRPSSARGRLDGP